MMIRKLWGRQNFSVLLMERNDSIFSYEQVTSDLIDVKTFFDLEKLTGVRR